MNIVKQIIENSKIDCHKEFINDLDKLKKSDLSGSLKQFNKAFLRQMIYINDFEIDDLYRFDSNEILKNTNNLKLFSLHLKSNTFNVRFLCTPVDNKLVLLVAFNEREGKKKTSYVNHIQIAIERFDEWKGEKYE